MAAGAYDRARAEPVFSPVAIAPELPSRARARAVQKRPKTGKVDEASNLGRGASPLQYARALPQGDHNGLV
jgi:hypothetical protein